MKAAGIMASSALDDMLLSSQQSKFGSQISRRFTINSRLTGAVSRRFTKNIRPSAIGAHRPITEA